MIPHVVKKSTDGVNDLKQPEYFVKGKKGRPKVFIQDADRVRISYLHILKKSGRKQILKFKNNVGGFKITLA